MPLGHPTSDGSPLAGVGYDADAEARAFERLRKLDIPGCREAFRSLVAGLRTGPSTTRQERRVITLVLHDVAQELHRRLAASHPVRAADPASRRREPRLVEWFARFDDVAAVRKAFLDAVDGMLAPWDGQGRNSHPVVRRARLFIRENYHARVTLSSVARKLGVSANYLSRQFRRETGVTLTTFVHQVRLERARELLGEGSRSMSEIAYQVGYQNYRDFYRNFVKHENASPSEVQRRLAEPASSQT